MTLDRLLSPALDGVGLPLLVLIVLSAGGYALATVGMKLALTASLPLAVLVIVTGFALAGVGEIVLLRQAPLSVVYLTIMGVETLLVLGYAAMIGEGLDLRGILGGGLVLAGLALVAH